MVVMATMMYFTLPRVEELEPQQQMRFRIIHRIASFCGGKLNPLLGIH